MPLVRVTMIKGKSPDYIKKMSASIYEALVEAYQMTENDLFQIIEQLQPGDLIYDHHFGIKGSRSGDFVIINIESDARRRGEKEAFLARLSDKLAASPGIARDDVFVRLSMTAGLEDWSLGSGPRRGTPQRSLVCRTSDSSDRTLFKGNHIRLLFAYGAICREWVTASWSI